MDSLLDTMSETGADFTDIFRILSEIKLDGSNKVEIVGKAVQVCASVELLKK